MQSKIYRGKNTFITPDKSFSDVTNNIDEKNAASSIAIKNIECAPSMLKVLNITSYAIVIPTMHIGSRKAIITCTGIKFLNFFPTIK